MAESACSICAPCQDSQLSTAASIISILTFAYGIFVGAMVASYRTANVVKETPQELQKIGQSLLSDYRDIQRFAQQVAAWGQEYLPAPGRYGTVDPGPTRIDSEDQQLLGRARVLFRAAEEQLNELEPHVGHVREVTASSKRKRMLGSARHAINRDRILEMLKEKGEIMQQLHTVKQEIEARVFEYDRLKHNRLLLKVLSELRELREQRSTGQRPDTADGGHGHGARTEDEDGREIPNEPAASSKENALASLIRPHRPEQAVEVEEDILVSLMRPRRALTMPLPQSQDRRVSATNFDDAQDTDPAHQEVEKSQV